jgi:hypothetical protein
MGPVDDSGKILVPSIIALIIIAWLAPPATAGDTLVQIESSGTLRCGVSEGIVSFSTKDASDTGRERHANRCLRQHRQRRHLRAQWQTDHVRRLAALQACRSRPVSLRRPPSTSWPFSTSCAERGLWGLSHPHDHYADLGAKFNSCQIFIGSIIYALLSAVPARLIISEEMEEEVRDTDCRTRSITQ